MLRTASLLCVLAAMAACLTLAVSCGNASTADAAPRAHEPDSTRHELTLVRADGTEHKMEVYGFSHEVISPRDAASGLPTGKRQHKPFTVRKRVDKSTPIIANSLVANDVFETGTLTSYRRRGGAEEVYRLIILLRPWISTREDDTDPFDHEVREHVSFTYQKITWTWTDGGITAEDDWESPR